MLTTLLLLLSIGITTSIQPASGSDTLIQVQVISRHGARTALTKTASALLEGGAVLTPIGEKQLYDLGVLKGVVESNLKIISLIRKEYKDIQFFSNLNDALECNFDGYVVATPPNTHYEIAKKIIINKKHLLVEKPFTLNEKDAIELHDLSKKYKVRFWRRGTNFFL